MRYHYRVSQRNACLPGGRQTESRHRTQAAAVNEAARRNRAFHRHNPASWNVTYMVGFAAEEWTGREWEEIEA